MNASGAAAHAVLFPGQGSQHRGMGAGLFERFPALTDLAREVLGYDLPLLCQQDPDGRLDDTRYAQPALYVVNALSYLDSVAAGEPEGEFLLGHSLGEYNALHAAGVFDFETGLKLVAKRGELMSRAGGGGMLAVLGLGHDELRGLLAEHELSELDLANINTDAQLVLSGDRAQLDRARRELELRRVRCAPLKVSGAFHSRWMAPARDEFAAFLRGFRFEPPRATVIANLTALPHAENDLAATLAEQITEPVRWLDSVRYLLRRTTPERCREAGGSGVLTRMLGQIAATPPAERTRPRVFGIAHAGGDERAYAGLAEQAPDLDVVVLERPGRGTRSGEPLLSDPVAIVEDLLARLRDRLDDATPYALYGHSLGARLAFLLCHRIRQEGLPAPAHLLVSGESGPALPSRERDTWRLPGAEFWERLERLGGLPAELREHEDLMAFYERVLRADFTALAAFTHPDLPPLDLPITAITGEDEWFTRADVEAWQQESTRPLRTHRFPGDHFFIRQQWPALGRIARCALATT
ncbi:ACP S-malonyltransferase [Saccharopolyspora sp. MS10]|uniref:ACP S-malonyltransferase n=1 Tax=Saccharopolyspora sp. MS10 TaxID=3385973 RepID=UPI0039A09D9F